MRRKLIDGRVGRSLVSERVQGSMAIATSAMSIFWDWGCGQENVTLGTSRVVTIDGPLERQSFWYDGYDAILDRFKEACSDTETTSVILRMSSPGGECSGLFECCDLMRRVAAKSGKRIVAVADDSAYSAAYALACVASEIYLSQSSGVGSVGVLAVVGDCVKMNEKAGLNIVVVHAGARKVDGHPDVPLTDDAVATFQGTVDRFAGMFYELVGDSRAMKPEDVTALEAACFMGDDAVAVGLADGLMTFDQVVAMIAADAVKPETEDNPDNEDQNMGAKTTGHKTAAESGATDAFATAQVAPVDLAAMAAIAGTLSVGQPRASTDSKEDDNEEDVEADEDSDSDDADDDDEDDDKKSKDKSEKDEAKDKAKDKDADDDDDDDADDSDDEDDDADDDDDDKKDKEKSKKEEAARHRPQISAGSNAADVLRAVKELTGESSPAAQIASLMGIADKASSADRVVRSAKASRRKTIKAEKRAVVKDAIKAGKIAPAQKEYWLSQPLKAVKAYLKSAPVSVVRTSASPTKPGKAVKRKADAALDKSIAAVARLCGADPKAVADHAAKLKAAGTIG